MSICLVVTVYSCIKVVKQREREMVQVEVGDDVTLFCDYKLEEDTLYSIKWYRDDREFFRFIPRGKIFNPLVKNN